MFEFLRTSTLYSHKKTDLIKGHKYRQGDFIIKVGSFTVGHTTSATGATQQPYPKLFFVQVEYLAYYGDFSQIFKQFDAKLHGNPLSHSNQFV
jgi:hypothetical protein